MAVCRVSTHQILISIHTKRPILQWYLKLLRNHFYLNVLISKCPKHWFFWISITRLLFNLLQNLLKLYLEKSTLLGPLLNCRGSEGFKLKCSVLFLNFDSWYWPNPLLKIGSVEFFGFDIDNSLKIFFSGIKLFYDQQT